MKAYLVAISIGPVQDFIAAARRTRDFWFGSKLLSEISFAAAQAIVEHRQGGRMIFPPESLFRNSGKHEDTNVANIIIAEVTAENEAGIRHVIRRAEMSAELRLKRFAQNTLKSNALKDYIQIDLWNEQIEDIIEFYAAWTLFQGDYKKSRKALMSVLSGRKNLRDFKQSQYDLSHCIYKSSLDGARETVLLNHACQTMRRKSPGLFKAMRLKDGEELDAVGVIKRLAGGQNKTYPSVSRLAVDSWLRGLWRKDNDAVRNALKSIAADWHHISEKRLSTVEYPQYKLFPLEGTLFFEFRHPVIIEELLQGNPDKMHALSKQIRQLIRNSDDGTGPVSSEPHPYFAVLQADGDRMGKAISSLDNIEQNQNFSKDLNAFAYAATEIVKNYFGCTVYAGGDDVLAFLPLDTCLECAEKLHDDFAERLKNYAPADSGPTLSVGIAVCHFLEPLEDILIAAREAEKDAKSPDRDGLAIHLHVHSGSVLKIRDRWSGMPANQRFIDRMKTWIKFMLNGDISTKALYDLRKLARTYKGWKTKDFTNSAALSRDALIELIRKDIALLLKRKDSRETEALQSFLTASFEQLKGDSRLQPWQTALRIAEELILAKHFARAFALSGASPDASDTMQNYYTDKTEGGDAA